MRPQKRLLGISAPNNQTSKKIISTLLDVLNLEHINLRQPLINMLATTANMHPTLWDQDVAPTAKIAHLGHTVEDTEIALAYSLRTLNHEYFINHAKAAIANSGKGMHIELFDGFLISSVNTEAEAKWIRSQGGHMLHIYEREFTSGYNHIAFAQGDSTYTASHTDQINKQHLRKLILQLLERTQPSQKAAA